MNAIPLYTGNLIKIIKNENVMNKYNLINKLQTDDVIGAFLRRRSRIILTFNLSNSVSF